MFFFFLFFFLGEDFSLVFVPCLPGSYLEGFLSGWLVDGGAKSPRGTSRNAYLGEISRDDGPVCEFAAGEGGQCFTGRICVVVFDKDFAYAGRLSGAAAWPRHFHLKHFAIFLALFLYVFADFCRKLVSIWKTSRLESKKVERVQYLHILDCR